MSTSRIRIVAAVALPITATNLQPEASACRGFRVALCPVS
jgi:hypothetical protein